MFLIDKNLNPSVETKPDPRSIEGLIAWLETMPAGGEYPGGDPCGCALAQYYEQIGKPGDDYYWHFFPHCDEFADGSWESQIANVHPHTFGGMLSRARAYQAKVRT